MARPLPIALALALLAVPPLAARPAADSDAPPAREGSDGRTPDIGDGQRQQPTRERTQELLDQGGAARPPSVARGQLRDLNAISRDLLPPGAPLPAPGARPAPDRSGGIPATGSDGTPAAPAGGGGR